MNNAQPKNKIPSPITGHGVPEIWNTSVPEIWTTKWNKWSRKLDHSLHPTGPENWTISYIPSGVGWEGSLRESTKHQPHEVPSASPRNRAYSRRRV